MAPLSSIAAILICLCSMTVATPLLSRQTTADIREACTTLHQRKAWHDLTAEDKSAYIEAELCLMNSPPKTGHPLAQNRWDEFTITHTVQTQWVHNVGGFLPWHRYFVLAHENALRNECNYTGYQPYWEETLDMGDLASSLLFDPVTGFGGQGGECLDDGPFSNLTIHVSYNFTSLEFYADNRCVSRSFDNEFFLTGNQTSVDDCFAIEDGTIALDCYWANPHFAGHGGIGGTMANSAASIGDPLFFLHHAYVDRLWWEWQQVDPDTRTNAIGPLRNHPTEAYLARESLPAPGPEFLDYSGDDGGNITTLNHVLWLTGLEPNVTIADVMDLSNNLNCAEYV